MLRNCQNYFFSVTDEETEAQSSFPEAQASLLPNPLALKDKKGSKASFSEAGLA